MLPAITASEAHNFPARLTLNTPPLPAQKAQSEEVALNPTVPSDD